MSPFENSSAVNLTERIATAGRISGDLSPPGLVFERKKWYFFLQ
jgi:hypothetical protein